MSGTIFAERYEILRKKGEGGMAIVYKAEQLDNGRTVALKVLRPELSGDSGFVQRFMREAQALSGLSHPNIVQTYDAGKYNNQYYIAMEYIEGENLKNYIARKGEISAQMAVYIAAQICHALQHAHSRNVIHRDIKASNILLSKNGTVKVADFGLAKVANTNTISYNKGDVIGSVYYISPEQVRGATSTERSDIYSLGVILYEMLTGKVPFSGETAVAVAVQHTKGAFPDPKEEQPDIPESLRRIITKATRREPYRRYSSASEMELDLQRALRDTDGEYVTEIPLQERHVRTITLPQGIEPSTEQEQEGIIRSMDRRRARRIGQREDEQILAANSGAKTARLLITMFLVIGMVVGVIAFGIITFSRNRTTQSQKVLVPFLIGKEEEDSRVELSELLLQARVQFQNGVETDGVVIAQTPSGGEEIIQGGTVTIMIGTALPSITQVPNLIGLNYNNAFTAIEKSGYVRGQVLRTQSDVGAQTVIEQYPPPYAYAEAGTPIDITIGYGDQNSDSPE